MFHISLGQKDSQSYYFVPQLSITSPPWAGFSVKLTRDEATDFGLNKPAKESSYFVFNNADLESFTILQEAYLAFDSGDSSEIASYTNRSVTDLMLTSGYLHKLAGVWDSGANSTEFQPMSDASYMAAEDKKCADESSVFYLGAQYNNETHNAQPKTGIQIYARPL